MNMSDEIVDIVLKMKVPLKIKYDKLETLKWRLQKTVELTETSLIREMIQNLDIKTYKNK